MRLVARCDHVGLGDEKDNSELVGRNRHPWLIAAEALALADVIPRKVVADQHLMICVFTSRRKPRCTLYLETPCLGTAHAPRFVELTTDCVLF